MGLNEPAAVDSVDCTGNACATLRGAINSAASGDTIVFAPALDGQAIALFQCSNAPSGTQFGPSAFFITGNRSLTIDARAGLARGITITVNPYGGLCTRLAPSSLSGTFRLFDIDPGASLTLRGLTLTNGAARGGTSATGGSALGAGGAIFNQGTLVVEQGTFADNSAEGGSVREIVYVSAIGGAGVGGDAQSLNGGFPNAGAADGGFGGGGSFTVSPPGPHDGGFGGGGSAGNPIAGNGGFGAGGGGATSGGAGGFGGGNGGTFGGGAAGMGGAIFNDAGTVALRNVTFYANRASGSAGVDPASGNGSGFGGAIFNYSGSVTIQYGTLVGNRVAAGSGGSGGSADGGAIYSLADGNCNLGGNVCAASTASLELDNTIAANNPGAANDVVLSVLNGAAVLDLGAGNLITHYEPAQFSAARVVSSADPQLVSLGVHGGPAMTLVPRAGSPAVDAVACNQPTLPADDERGTSRPQGAQCDIGAVERDAAIDTDWIFNDSFDY